ncbi:MAG: hypothetical protein HQ509_11960 [Candidatus Marinimicrobia bacterium]|nr:hypothetical protein [Candidatus Neomarinimicrobiota bacterium]
MQKVYEPATVITDGLITLLGIYIGFDLLQYSFFSFQYLWGIAFFGMALSALFGAIRHGWGPHWNKSASITLNRLTYFGIGVTTVTMLFASVGWFFESESCLLQIIIGLSFFVYIFFAFKQMRFRIVIYYYFPTLALIFIAMTIGWIQEEVGAGQVAIGLGISFVAAGIQMSGWNIHRHFNHNDLYHVIQLLGMWVVYEGVLLIK